MDSFKALITLLAIVNPPAIVPFFIHYTHGFSRAERQHTILVASFSAFLVIAASALLGIRILEFFDSIGVTRRDGDRRKVRADYFLIVGTASPYPRPLDKPARSTAP